MGSTAITTNYTVITNVL